MSKDRLAEYSAKRRFDATPEPAPGASGARRGPLLFVVQKHSARRLHYDFRLECDGVLKSWAVPKGPSCDPAEKRLAVPTEDHPFEYASFEGVIPPGQYGAGEVIVWDCGVYSPDEGGTWFHDREAAEARVRDGLAAGKLSILLRGQKTKGSFALVRGADGKNWLLIKHKDRFASTSELPLQDRSVLSQMTVAEAKGAPVRRMAAELLVPGGEAEAFPERLAPMHAESGESAFDDPDWRWEPKLDGYRVLAFVKDGDVRLVSRRGLELRAFPRLNAELAGQAASMVLDGELVAVDAFGTPSFGALQNRVQLTGEREIAAADRSSPTVLYCFDLLHFAGINLRGHAYADRRRYLLQCLLPGPLLKPVHAEREGAALLAASLESGLEGVIGKRNDSRYQAGRRSSAWLKVKALQSGDFVIGGYTEGKGSRAPLGALLVGYREGKRLRYASHVGSGFDADTPSRLKALLEPLRTETCPFDERPELHRKTHWVKPRLVAEVRYQNWTDDGFLRAPVFLRLRDDLDAGKIRRPRAARKAPMAERPEAAGELGEVLRQLENPRSSFVLEVSGSPVKLTHLDRVYWPAEPALKQAALTKRDLLRYLAQVSPYMLPHLMDRPLTMIRMPDGIFGQRFFQKHWAQERPPFVETLTVFSGHKDESHDYLLCNNLGTLLWLAQSGTLEFHVWHSRARPAPDSASQATDYASSLESLEASVLNFPDYVVFDIDPYIYSGKEPPGAEPELNTVAFEKGKEVAFHLRELLQSMRLDALVKTSGKTGLHVFVPIRRTLDFDAARAVSEAVGRHLEARHPGDITLEWSVPKRAGKIFMDYNMNVRGKTLNVAYSPRGAAGAPVSMPLTWDELAKAHPLDFRIDNAARRLAATGDRWHEALERKFSLEASLKAAKA
jgi:bifunctional non-homologous end joining protein LigD